MANDIFQTALVKKPKRSRFDFSHSNTFGIKIGYAYPTETRFIVPGDEVAVSMSQVARLAPMPVPTFADLKVRHDFFFVPCRLMYNEADMSSIFGSAGSDNTKERASLPLSYFITGFSMDSRYEDYDPEGEGHTEATWLARNNYMGDLYLPGSLFDFLGYPVPNDKYGPASAITTAVRTLDNAYVNNDDASDQYAAYASFMESGVLDQVTSAKVLLEPLAAYHFIWRDWYRFTGVQDDSVNEGYFENHFLSAPVSLSSQEIETCFPVEDWFNPDYFHPGSRGPQSFGRVLGRLRQVHLAKDMFTSVRYGNKPAVLIPTGDNANIPTLREASAIQRFIDLVSIVGSRYYDKVKALFNVKATGFADDRVQFLARYQQFIKIGEVLTTATTNEANTGDYAGRGILIDGQYLFRRRFDEPGWLMCITSVVPDIAYDGLSRQLTDTFFVDTPIPSLAEIGDQTVYNREVCFDFTGSATNDLSFGDQFRYYAYKSATNEVHGSMKMDSMRSWVPTQDYYGAFDVIGYSQVSPYYWNKFFNDTTSSPIFGDRFFFKIEFSEYITRQLPKYINYHL